MKNRLVNFKGLDPSSESNKTATHVKTTYKQDPILFTLKKPYLTPLLSAYACLGVHYMFLKATRVIFAFGTSEYPNECLEVL